MFLKFGDDLKVRGRTHKLKSPGSRFKRCQEEGKIANTDKMESVGIIVKSCMCNQNSHCTRGGWGKMVPMWDCLPNINQCDFDVDKVNVPIGYINRNIITRTEEMIKYLITIHWSNCRLFCDWIWMRIFRTILTNTNMTREGQKERGQWWEVGGKGLWKWCHIKNDKSNCGRPV